MILLTIIAIYSVKQHWPSTVFGWVTATRKKTQNSCLLLKLKQKKKSDIINYPASNSVGVSQKLIFTKLQRFTLTVCIRVFVRKTSSSTRAVKGWSPSSSTTQTFSLFTRSEDCGCGRNRQQERSVADLRP